MTDLPICPDCALHSSLVPHNDLVTLPRNNWFTVNFVECPSTFGVSMTASKSLPFCHHVNVGFGRPEITMRISSARVEVEMDHC